jgi:hypothetical protein
MGAPSPPPGWYPDPTGLRRQVYWDGQRWHQPPAPRKMSHLQIAGIVGIVIVGTAILGIGFALHHKTSRGSTATGSSLQSSAAPGATPPPVGLNQEARDGKFAFVVTSVDTAKTAHDPDNPFTQQIAKGTYVNIHLTVKNIANRPQTFFADNQRLWVGDRQFSPDRMAAVWAKASNVRIDPGSSITAEVTFDVPAGATGADTVELHDSALSAGVKVVARP